MEMTELDPRTKMLVRTIGFIIFLVGITAFYLGFTSSNIEPIHAYTFYIFGILTMAVGLFLIIAKYGEITV